MSGLQIDPLLLNALPQWQARRRRRPRRRPRSCCSPDACPVVVVVVVITPFLLWQALLMPHALAACLPGLLGGVGIMFVLQRYRHFLVLPALLFAIPLLFYAIAACETARVRLTPAPSERRGIIAARARDNLYGHNSGCHLACSPTRHLSASCGRSALFFLRRTTAPSPSTTRPTTVVRST